MLTSYCIFPNNTKLKNGQKVPVTRKMYEYGECIYPEGVLDNNMVCAFIIVKLKNLLYGIYYRFTVRTIKDFNGRYEIYKKNMKQTK